MKTKKRVIVFVLITYALTWVPCAVLFVMGYDLTDMVGLAFTMGVMFMPAVASFITRALTGEGFRGLNVKPNFGKNKSTYLLAWVAPPLLIIFGGLLYFLLFPAQLTFDLAESAASSLVPSDITLPPFQIPPIAILAICFAGLILGPVVNFVPSFGEELGWRGYLFPKLLSITSPFRATVFGGIIWGVWHAPLVALGLKYGRGYPLAPYSGILGMMLLCILLGAFMNYTFLKTNSVVPATLIHGSFNALCELGGLLVVAGANPLIGPKPIGIVGGAGFILAGVVSLAYLRRKSSTTR